jgi:hypothetical protein
MTAPNYFQLENYAYLKQEVSDQIRRYLTQSPSTTANTLNISGGLDEASFIAQVKSSDTISSLPEIYIPLATWPAISSTVQGAYTFSLDILNASQATVARIYIPNAVTFNISNGGQGIVTTLNSGNVDLWGSLSSPNLQPKFTIASTQLSEFLIYDASANAMVINPGVAVRALANALGTYSNLLNTQLDSFLTTTGNTYRISLDFTESSALNYLLPKDANGQRVTKIQASFSESLNSSTEIVQYQTINEDSVWTISKADLGTLAAGRNVIQFKQLATEGALKINGRDVLLNEVISISDIEAGRLTYQPPSHSSIGFGEVARFVSGTNSSFELVTKSLAISVLPLNDTPTGAVSVGGS